MTEQCETPHFPQIDVHWINGVLILFGRNTCRASPIYFSAVAEYTAAPVILFLGSSLIMTIILWAIIVIEVINSGQFVH